MYYACEFKEEATRQAYDFAKKRLDNFDSI